MVVDSADRRIFYAQDPTGLDYSTISVTQLMDIIKKPHQLEYRFGDHTAVITKDKVRIGSCVFDREGFLGLADAVVNFK